MHSVNLTLTNGGVWVVIKNFLAPLLSRITAISTDNYKRCIEIECDALTQDFEGKRVTGGAACPSFSQVMIQGMFTLLLCRSEQHRCSSS